MKIEDVAKKVKRGIGERMYPTGQLASPGCNNQLYVNITRAVNGFVVNANGDQAVCTDIGELQAFLEVLYAAGLNSL